MRALLSAMTAVFGWVTPALAATGGAVQGVSIILILFIGFAALIIVLQFIPGLALFFSMVKGLFRAAPKNGPNTREKK